MNFRNLWSKSFDAQALVASHSRPKDPAAAELFDYLHSGGFDWEEHLAVLAAKKSARRAALARLTDLRERLDVESVDAAWMEEIDRTNRGLKRGLGISTAPDEETQRRLNRERVAAHRQRAKALAMEGAR
jgi:hypothetical protein